MAFFDESQDNVVLRVVYVGPPFSGKTESLRMLSRILKGKSDEDHVFSPADSFGRTLYFDWFDHSAGLFRGRPIRCQIIAVPGQTTLTTRRKMLVDMADCVVFVADSTPSRWGKNREFLDEIIPWIKEPTPPIGMIFQLNKQDSPSAHSVEAFRSVLAELSYSNPVIRPSSATNGEGLREAFISAVSLGLDRVHALVESKTLPSGKALDLNDGQQLFEIMTRQEQEAPATKLVRLSVAEDIVSAASSQERKPEAIFPAPEDFSAASDLAVEKAQESVVVTPVASEQERQPESLSVPEGLNTAPVSAVEKSQESVFTTPGSETVSVPKPEVSPVEIDLVMKGLRTHVVAGGVYPPVRGRERLYAAVAGMSQPELRSDGSWFVCAPDWVIRSTRTEQFESLMAARQHLLALAQTNEAVKSVMVGERFIAVAESGDNRYRVWQGVSAGLSAGEWLRTGAQQPDVLRSTTMLLVIAKRLREMLARLQGNPERLALTLDNMTVCGEELLYSGFLEDSGSRSFEISLPTERFLTILDQHLQTWPVTRRAEVRDLLSGEMRAALAQSDEQRTALDAVTELLERPADLVNLRT